MTQRETYKLIERLLSVRFDSETDLLIALIHHIVEREEMTITGGRLWELHPTENMYVLRYQEGDIGEIPQGYTVQISEQPVFALLAQRKTVMNFETDKLLMQKGISLYSATGVGELERRGDAKFYQYALAFNGSGPDQQFFDLLSVVGSAATTAIRNRSRQQEQEKIKRDLDKAQELQRSLLPEHTFTFSDYSVFGVSLPDSIVGGDYFDYLQAPDDEERVGIVISDAASKGLAAAAQALFVSGAIRMSVGYQTKISSMIGRLNTLIYDTFPFERFVTMCYCELTSSANGLVLYANAGHCSPLHYSAMKNDCSQLNPTGGILGILPQQKIGVENINMSAGDILLLYTDGISEAQDAQGIQYGTDRLATVLQKNAMATAQEIAWAILEDVQHFSAGATYSDDSTVVVIKREKTEKNKVSKH
jgi:sigma-B regulation protein RsbU (phosphoserine phosphatase)